ncbi:MAG: YidC/Oxa1 family insertase periplasmic-domain containing protein, partial [Candidatus Hydrogenedentes bacterium]|nr:YidC/Oxa1 family insertase periplasmic-domain containing protein [Candidatus Hydrogenedentota bacterium]
SGDEHTRIQQELVWREAGENDSIYVAKLAKNSPYTISDPAWIGVKSAYYLVAMKPEYEHAHLWAAGNDTAYLFGLAAPRFEVAPGEAVSQRFQLYVGPSKTEYLALAWETLPSVRRFFTMFDVMDWFAKMLLAMLNWFYGIIPNYGVAIILLTIVVRGSMLPLTLKSAKSMKSMQKLAPEMEALRAKYADEPQELQQKMMEMYRERGVNPVGGCLPMVLQMPIFFALYRMLMGAYELRGAPFPIVSMGDYVWIRDLSQPDHLLELSFLHDVPFIGEYLAYLNILPFLMGGAMFLNTKILPPTGPVVNPQQKMIMNLMPVIFCVFCYNLASGLNLYIFVSTLVGIAQQAIVRSIDVESPPPKKKVARKKQHFYKAAQERKRRMVKETKSDKKSR